MTGQRRIFLLVLGLLISWSLHVCAAESDPTPSVDALAVNTPSLVIPPAPNLQTEDSRLVGPVGFNVVFFGIEDAGLERFLRQNSLLSKRRDNPPETVLSLKQLAVDDLGHMQRALATQGYYDAEFDYFVDTRKKPFIVYVKVRLGAVYTVGAFKLKSDPPGNMQMSILEDNIEGLGITLGQPGKAEYFRQASEKALNQLQKHGYPFAKVKPGGDRIVVDRVAKTIQAAFLISPGPLARFGKVQMDNVAGVAPEFLKARLQWKEGDIYNEEKILDTVEALYNTRLFKNIKIIHEDALDPKTGLLNIYIRADSNPKSGLEGSLLYSSNSKHDARVAWEKRNFRGTGELLRLGAAVGTYRKMFEGSFVQPDMFMLNLEMASRLTAGANTTPGYSSKGFTLQSTLQYPFMRLLVGSGGLGMDIQQAGPKAGGTKPYRYLTVPLMMRYQTAGLNGFVRKGYQATVKMTPHVQVLSKKVQVFDTVQINQRAYVPLAINGKLAFEPWANIGMTPGAGKHAVPLHKRFYVGGADSVRGYSYQMASPLDAKGNPIGGMSSVAFGSELKYYLSEKLSMLSFLDFGAVFKNGFPDFSSQLMCGVGVGMRYDTPIGTLGLDVGSALRRRDQDDAVQVYIGLDKKI